MLELKIIQELKPNTEILEIIKSYTYITKNGKVKHLEQKLGGILNELTRYMYNTDNEIIVCNSTKTKEIKNIDSAIEKLKQQKKLVDLYLSSTLNVEVINHKNEIIKKEIDKLNQKKNKLDPDDDFKDYTVELLKNLDCDYQDDNNILFQFC